MEVTSNHHLDITPMTLQLIITITDLCNLLLKTLPRLLAVVIIHNPGTPGHVPRLMTIEVMMKYLLLPL